MAALVSRRDALRFRIEAREPIVCDGGMGAELRKRGWIGPTEDANVHAPQTVEEIHRAFRQAGAEILLTNTFTVAARPVKEVGALVSAGVARARAAADGAFVAGSLGPVPLSQGNSILEAARAFEAEGVDAVFLETMTSERIANRTKDLVRKHVELAILVVSYTPAPGLFIPAPHPRIGGTWSHLGVNCADPKTTLELVATRTRGGAFAARPSAGLPTGEGRGLEYPVTPEEFGAFAREAAKLGARIIGGCCGASPAHIAAIAKEIRAR